MSLKTIYNSIFGKDYGPVWQQFAKETNGTYSSPFGEDRVEFTFKDYKITLDNHTHYIVVGSRTDSRQYSRGIVEFISSDNLKMRVVPQDFIETIGKLFGAQDIIIGNKLFDKKFMIRGTDESKIKQLFNDPIIDFLLKQKVVRLEITDGEGLFDEKPPAGNSMLYYVADNRITHIDHLKTLHNFFSDLIESLTKSGSIKPAKPIPPKLIKPS